MVARVDRSLLCTRFAIPLLSGSAFIEGMILPMSTTTALVLDGLLAAGFGVQHSVLATLRTKAHVLRLVGINALSWRSVESLVNVVYILVAASLWRSTSSVIWSTSGAMAGLILAVGVASWLWYWQLHLFEYDCGLAFGSTTLVARLAGRAGPKLVPWKVGSRRWIRFPVHTAFFGMFFALPVMTADLLVLAMVINVYNVIGSVLYDKRVEKLSGEPYVAYEAKTGLIWPPLYRALMGAHALTMPAPAHWRRSARHLPGVVVGLLLGAGYFFVLGSAGHAPLDMAKVALAGLVGAVLCGYVFGRVLRPDRDVAWDQQQTDLSTTVALAAALGVVSWAGLSWIVLGSLPAFAAFLPLWFTVQYLGHVAAFAAAPQKWGSLRTVEVVQPDARVAAS